MVFRSQTFIHFNSIIYTLTLGLTIWLGFISIFNPLAKAFDGVGINVRTTSLWSGMNHAFPGVGEEFMPALDEGSFLLMPTSMPHSGFEQNKLVVQQLDMLLANVLGS